MQTCLIIIQQFGNPSSFFLWYVVCEKKKYNNRVLKIQIFPKTNKYIRL